MDDVALRLRGVLDRAAVIALWPQLQALPAQLARLELGEVERVDSAGLALLAELAARARKAGHPLAISGAPAPNRSPPSPCCSVVRFSRRSAAGCMRSKYGSSGR